MTFRARPAAKPQRTRARQSGRRTLVTNLLFGGVVVFALLILAVAAGVNWYSQHLATVATINGQTITIDDFTNRYAVDLWRLNAIESRIRDAANVGLITNEQRDQEIATIASEKQNPTTLAGASLESLIDARLQAQLAATQGVTVTEAQVDAALVKEATNNEQRHAWFIESAPDLESGSSTPTAAADAAALAKAKALLARLVKGEDWTVVAKDSTDPLTTTSGDQGFISASADLDKPTLDAIFALPANGRTDVVKGADGVYRIARVTQIVPGSVDANYIQGIKNAGVSVDAYRAAVRADVTRQALTDKIVADSTIQVGPQRHVLELRLTQEFDQTTNQPILTDQVDVRHILYAPGGKDAAGSPPPETDPAWADAKAKADATYQLLLKDPSKFQDIAKSDSADTSSGATGGDIGYQAQSALDPGFGTAIFKAGLKAGDILPPVKSAYGWHVIQFIGRKAPAFSRMQQYINQLANPTEFADFGYLARAYSEAPDSNKGGDMGWIGHNQLSKKVEDAIFATPVGKVSDMLIDGTSVYIFKVLAEETRLPDKDQITALTSSAFSNWYAAEKDKATIDVAADYQQYLQSSGS
jgi:parvulin-like peptidyl-prolyl isomerase